MCVREKFIPVSRHSLVRFLMQKKYFINEGELKKFESFAIALDSAIVNKYHDVWREIKVDVVANSSKRNNVHHHLSVIM